MRAFVSSRRRLLLAGISGTVLVLLVVSLAWTHSAFGGASGPLWRADGLQGVLIHAVSPAAGRTGIVVTGGSDGVYRRGPNGIWQRVLRANEVWSASVSADGRTIIAGDNDGYFSISRDGGRHWRRSRVAAGGVFAVSAQPGSAGNLLAGGDAGLYTSLDGGRSWRQRLRLKNSAIAAISWQSSQGRTVLAGAVPGAQTGNTDVYISHDAGRTWRRLGQRLSRQGGIMSLLVTAHGDVLAGTMGHRVWRIATRSAGWRERASGFPNGSVHIAGLTAAPGKRGGLFAATLGQGVYRSGDGGRQWSPISDGLPSQDRTIVLAVAYDARGRMILAGTTDGVYARKLS